HTSRGGKIVSPAFIAHRWPKCNSDYVVEECDAIRAANLPQRDGRRYLPHPHTPVHAVRRGASLMWCFECPGCGMLVETLYRPPGDAAGPVDWQSELRTTELERTQRAVAELSAVPGQLRGLFSFAVLGWGTTVT